MPGIEERETVASEETVSPRDYFSRDVDELVYEIKENLRLSSFKKAAERRSSRPSPYRRPRFEGQETPDGRCFLRRRLEHRRRDPGPEDAYEMLQELIRNGSLIKEAVRRLQKGIPSKRMYLCESDEESSRSPGKFFLQKRDGPPFKIG